MTNLSAGDRLTKHAIIGTQAGRQGAGQTCPEDLVLCHSCGWMLCSEYHRHIEDIVADANAEVRELQDRIKTLKHRNDTQATAINNLEHRNDERIKYIKILHNKLRAISEEVNNSRKNNVTIVNNIRDIIEEYEHELEESNNDD